MLVPLLLLPLLAFSATNEECNTAIPLQLGEVVSGNFADVTEYPEGAVVLGDNYAENPSDAGPGLFYYLPHTEINTTDRYYMSVSTCIPGTSMVDGFQQGTLITVFRNTSDTWRTSCNESNLLQELYKVDDAFYDDGFVQHTCPLGFERAEGIFYFYQWNSDVIFLVQSQPSTGGAPFQFQVEMWTSQSRWAESRNYTQVHYYKDRCRDYPLYDGTCANALGCRVTQRANSCVPADLSPFFLCRDIDSENECESAGDVGYCEWDGNSCVYASTWCGYQHHSGTSQHACTAVSQYVGVYPNARDAQCFVDWPGGQWYSQAQQPFCSHSTGFNPEIDATLSTLECFELECPVGEHCAYVTYGNLRQRSATCVCDDVTRRPAVGSGTKFGCTDAPLRNRFGPGPVLGRFNGTFHSNMDTKCNIEDSVLQTGSFDYTFGCVSVCTDEASELPFSIEFLPDGGLVFSIQPEVVPYHYGLQKRSDFLYDGRALFFAPPYGLTFAATLAASVPVATRDKFAQGEAISVRYNVVRNEAFGTYDTRHSERPDIILTDDPCSIYQTRAECVVVRGCEYCGSTSTCFNIADNDDASETPWIQPDYFANTDCHASGLTRDGVPSGAWWLSGVASQSFCVSMIKDGDSIRIGVGSVREGFITNTTGFSSFCPVDVVNNNLDLSTPGASCTGGLPPATRDSYYNYYSSDETPPGNFGPIDVDAPLSATSVAVASCAEGSTCQLGVYQPESSCTGCPCTELSEDPNCIDEDGAGVAFGEAGCFDARCPGDGSPNSICGELVQPTANAATTQVRFCDAVRDTNIHSCNWISFTSTSASTSRYPTPTIGFDCSSQPFATECSEEGQLNAYCKVEPLGVNRIGQYIPIVGTNATYQREHRSDVQYLSFESIPSFGRIVLYSACVDEDCAKTGKPRDCFDSDSEPKSLLGRLNDPPPSISCPFGVVVDQVVSYDLDKHIWLFVPNEGVTNETEPELLVYELNGTHYGMVVAMQEVDEDAGFDIPTFGDMILENLADQAKDEGSVLTIVVAIVASIVALLLIIGIVQQCRTQGRQREALLARGGDKSVGGTQEMNTMKTMESGRGGTTANLGALINVDEEKSPLDPKYIIKPSDLLKDKKIGEGGYGYVYRGEWRDMEVAIKEVRGTEPEVVDMLMLEARAAIDLRPHENIVTLYGVCLEPFSIVTAFCSKGSLDDMLYGDNPVEFSDAELKRLCVGIASGISHLHHEGVIHRDLAARNILVNETGVPMVADFGMSRKDETAMEGTENQTKTTVGPIRWMAPEQLDSQLYSAFSDVWSFGVILYEIFARQVPWKQYSNMKAAQLVLNEHHLAEEKFCPKTVKPAVLKVMQACFAFESSSRPKMTWCVKKLSKDWDTADGGDAFRRAVVKREEDGGIYAAPPTKKVVPKPKPARSVEGTYDAPSVARSSVSSRLSTKRGKATSASAAEAPYDAPPESDEEPTEEAGGLYEAPVAKPTSVPVEEEGETYDIPSVSTGGTGEIEEDGGALEEDGGLYEAPVKQ